jgi:hypothetical protein
MARYDRAGYHSHRMAMAPNKRGKFLGSVEIQCPGRNGKSTIKPSISQL